jgi:hypothetical protein
VSIGGFIDGRLADDAEFLSSMAEAGAQAGESEEEREVLVSVLMAMMADQATREIIAAQELRGLPPSATGRMLREIEVKRRIRREHCTWAERHGEDGTIEARLPHCLGCGQDGRGRPRSATLDRCPTLRAAAASWSDHPGFLPGWDADPALPLTALIIRGGTGAGLLFSADFTIGKTGDLVVADEFASVKHAKCVLRDDGWYLEDLASTNGTWLNDERVYGPALLAKGDRIRIGRTDLIVSPAVVTQA